MTRWQPATTIPDRWPGDAPALWIAHGGVPSDYPRRISPEDLRGYQLQAGLLWCRVERGERVPPEVA